MSGEHNKRAGVPLALGMMVASNSCGFACSMPFALMSSTEAVLEERPEPYAPVTETLGLDPLVPAALH